MPRCGMITKKTVLVLGAGASKDYGFPVGNELNEKIKELTIKRAFSDEISAIAQKLGMATMLCDGVEKIFQGLTTLTEVIRVTR